MEEDEVLTRMAVQEIMREFGEKQQSNRPQESKINPLGKANKRFLGRTINSMITHNRRQDERKHRNCQRKLRDLEHRQRKRQRKRHISSRRQKVKDGDSNKRQRSESESSHEVFSSSSATTISDKSRVHRKKHKVKRKKRSRRRSQKRKSSASGRDSSSEQYDNGGSCADCEDIDFHSELPEGGVDFCLVPNAAHSMALAVATYNQYLNYQSLLDNAAATTPMEHDQELADFEETELSDLKALPMGAAAKKVEEISLLESSSSSSSEVETDTQSDNAIITIDLSSDNDDEPLQVQNKITNQSSDTKVQITSVDSDSDSENSDRELNASTCISLHSNANVEPSSAGAMSDIEILSSGSSSECEMKSPPGTPIGHKTLEAQPPASNANQPLVSNSDAADLTVDLT